MIYSLQRVCFTNLLLLAPTRALYVMMCYYISSATFFIFTQIDAIDATKKLSQTGRNLAVIQGQHFLNLENLVKDGQTC